MKRQIFSPLVILYGILLVFFVGMGALAITQAQTNSFTLSGRIVPPTAWNGGHTEKVWFTATNTDFRPKIVTNGTEVSLTGSFWMGTVGWATFGHNVGAQKPTINCPAGVLTGSLSNSGVICPISGAAWSQGAGWIVLGGNDIGGGHKGVYFSPHNANLEGFGWSRSLGWVPMFSGVNINDENKPVTPGTPPTVGDTGEGDYYTNPSHPTVPVNFIGKVAVLGNVAGTRVFQVQNVHNYINQNVGLSYNSVQHAPLINTVRSNVAHILRGVQISAGLQTHEKNGFIYNQEKDYCLGNSTESRTCAEQTDPSQRILLEPHQLDDTKTIIVK